MGYSGLRLFSTLLLAQEVPGCRILVVLFDLSHSSKIRVKAGFNRRPIKSFSDLWIPLISMAVAENKIGLTQFPSVVCCLFPMVDGTSSIYYQVYHLPLKMLGLVVYSFAKYQ